MRVRSIPDGLDPLGLVAAFPDRYPALLESAAALSGPRAVNCVDILPLCTGECLRLHSDGTLEGPFAGKGGFLDSLDAWWVSLKSAPSSARNGAAHEPTLPFTGGWLIYLGYELAAEIEPGLILPASGEPCVALALRTPAAWIRDHAGGRCWGVAEPGHQILLDRLMQDWRSLPAHGEAFDLRLDVDEENPGRYLQAVRGALEHIAAGDIYQANLSRQWAGSTAQDADPVALYRRLRRANPSPFAALLRDGDFAIVSSSPERLLRVRDGLLSTRPIAGTRPRGTTREADEALKRSLLEDDKERAEHVMMIDLERNDLGRICAGGSVRVDEHMTVETYAHVHHIVSTVSGRLRTDATPAAVLRALFPGGTITGCPKVRCMQIIAELERTGRGAYTGSLGYLDRNGDCDFNILIRTMTLSRNGVRFRTGAGIVADSIPERELAETRAKAEGLLRALSAE